MRFASTLLALALLAACSSSSRSGPAPTSSAPPAPPSQVATYATAAEAVAASCAAFSTFYDDLMRLTPHGSQVTLNDDTGKVLAPLLHTDATLDTAASKLYDDAGALVDHVGSSTWPDQGTPLDPEITAVQDDCG